MSTEIKICLGTVLAGSKLPRAAGRWRTKAAQAGARDPSRRGRWGAGESHHPTPARRRLPPPPHVLIAEYSTGTWVKGKESGNGRWGIRFRIHKASGVGGRGAGRPLPSPHHPAPPGRTRPGLRPDGQTDHWWWEAGGAGWGLPGRGVGGCDLGLEPHARVLGARLSLDTSLSSSPIQSTPVAVQPSMGLPSDSGKAKARTRCGHGPQATGSGGPRSSRLPCGCLSPAGAIRMHPSGGLATLPLPGQPALKGPRGRPRPPTSV